MKNFYFTDQFVYRHIGPREEDIKSMLDTVGVESLEELISKTIPTEIRLKKELNFDLPMSETELLEHLRIIASKNKIFKSYIGMGYYPTITPPVIKRNILENPGWYTQYTPYQAEISQGRLEALLNFQTVIADLTGLPLTNASLLDEATAAAEAMTMLYSSRKKEKKNADVFLVSENLFPQTLAVLNTRSEPLGIKLVIKNQNEFELDDDVFGIMVQYPDGNGEVYNYSNLFENAKMKNIFTSVIADIMSLVLLVPPCEFGADIAVGSTQRFGMPMGYGGPHAAYLATKEDFKRHIPGRIIGISIDRNGKPALRMALQMREQHIKREKATSNICTAQVLPAIMSGMYVVYHGPVGLKNIASRISKLTRLLDYGLKELGFKQINKYYFDTLKIELDSSELLKKIKKSALDKKINLRYFGNDAIGISVSEITSLKDIKILLDIFAGSKGEIFGEVKLNKIMESGDFDISKEFKRESKFLTHHVFNLYHSETAMMRYIKNLEKKDLSLTTSMIPLGSCTMKLNAAAEMASITWPEFAHIHPFVPISQTEGYQELIVGIQKQLCEITGFSGISLQPNSGALGEFTGLMVIREYHKQRNQGYRNIILIPSSAHGTNPASAVMAGNKPVIINCDEKGNIDIEDLKKKAEANADNLSALMVTYPSTHGIFEKDIVKICKIVHDNGGQVYMDGANMNAQVGYTSPKQIGADVCHLNLHKTFAIPHGGGGPGVGPIAVADHLIQYLPSHPVVSFNRNSGISAVTASPFGSANILPISYSYIKLMGTEGLKMSTAVAILNANYLQKKLSPYFNVVYTGYNGFVGHELIFDFRNFRKSANVEAEDVAKRLMDYGFHAPTVSFPVHGTLMVEPTESEPKEELDRFCSAMISIKKEIEEIENGTMDMEDNVLKNSPHISENLVTENWTHGYSRRKAVFPNDWVKENKFWPAAARIDNAYGDRHLVCSLPH